MSILLPLEPLTREAFRPFGDVVEAEGAEHFPINQGFAERFNDLAGINVEEGGGSAKVSFIVGRPRPTPLTLAVMERHPLGSQVFYPLQDRPWIVAVCDNPADAASYRVFWASGRQGVNYAKGTWHHPLLVLDEDSRFFVVDRKGPGSNLDEVDLAGRPLMRIAM